ncbi:MAG TPA: hypothetical protein VGI14_22790 [Casimicrobiaceae bacterium]|jgi:hypothetical protein
MKKAILPRIFAVLASIVVTMSIFDQVARMGQYADAPMLASEGAPVHVAAANR